MNEILRFPGYKIVKILNSPEHPEPYLVLLEKDEQLYVGKKLKRNSLGKKPDATVVRNMNEKGYTQMFASTPGFLNYYEEVQCIFLDTWMVIEYAIGGDLYDYATRCFKVDSHHPMGLAQRLWVFRECCRRLEVLHSEGIAHRDIKLENFVINKHGVICLMDFGFSCPAMNFYVSNELIGTMLYAAPEILKHNIYNPFKADMWAMGVLLYVFLFECLPFWDVDEPRIMRKIMAGKYSIPEKSPMVTTPVRTLLNKLLQTDPEKRMDISEILQVALLQKLTDLDAPDMLAFSTSSSPRRSSDEDEIHRLLEMSSEDEEDEEEEEEEERDFVSDFTKKKFLGGIRQRLKWKK